MARLGHEPSPPVSWRHWISASGGRNTTLGLGHCHHCHYYPVIILCLCTVSTVSDCLIKTTGITLSYHIPNWSCVPIVVLAATYPDQASGGGELREVLRAREIYLGDVKCSPPSYFSTQAYFYLFSPL